MPNLCFYFHLYIYVAVENNLTHRVGEILGFGVTTEGDTTMPCALQGAYIEIFTADECKESKLPSQVPNPRILCAGVIGGGVDSCKVRTMLNYVTAWYRVFLPKKTILFFYSGNGTVIRSAHRLALSWLC